MFDRSFLFVPSHEERYVVSAVNSNADYIVLDLEDSVPINMKKFARENIKKVAEKVLNRKILVRLNQLNSKTEDEIKNCYHKNISGFVLSKIKDEHDILNLEKKFKKIFKKNLSKINFFPLIENSQAVINIEKIIKSSKKIKGLIFGHEDYLVDTKGDITINYNALLYARSKVVNYCRANQIIPIDMAYLDIKNLIGCKNFCLESKSLGFDGMIAVYPKQIDIINDTFTPTEREIEKAKQIISLSKIKKNSIFLDNKGNYVGPPHLKKAKNILNYIKKIK